MFHREKNIEKKPVDYTNWEKDLGFLNLILSRKKNITKQYVIAVYTTQKKDKDYLTDEELEPMISNIITEVIKQIGDEYKQFLISKYFGTEENLIKFISEDVYVDLTTDAINRNLSKISSNLQKELVNKVNNLNKTKK